MAVQRYQEERDLPGVSREDGFAFVTDTANIPRWTAAVVSAEAVGDFGVGMEIHSISSMMGLKIKGVQQVTVVDEPACYTMAGTDPFPASFAYQFDEIAGGSRLTLTAEIEPKGLPGGGLVVGRFLKRQVKEMADNLRDLLTA